MANVIEILIRATDDASRVISNVDQRMVDFGTNISKLGTKLSVGLTLPLAAAGAAAIKMAMDMEQTTIAFTSMLGSADAAKKHLEALKDFAAKTPFEFTELTQASKRMMAFGFEAEKVVPMLRDIGDATSALGLGSEGIDRVTRALGQMQAKGKVSGEEMMQITEAGIPGWRYLADAMGVTTAEVMKMSEKGLIPASKAIDALLVGMRKDFGGMMAAQSKTAAGQLSNLKDSITAVGTSLGEVMLPTVKSAIGLVSALADTLKGMSPEMQQLVVTTGALAISLGPIMKISGTLIGNFKALSSVFLSVSGSALTMIKSVSDVASTLNTIGVTSYTVRDALIRLRASGALLTGELGLLAAGLIVIIKYLVEVNNTSKATTEELLKMANSGDMFLQAAAATNIITQGQDRLKVALDDVNEKLKKSGKSYDDYRSSLEAAANAAGYEIDAQGNLVSALDSGMGVGHAMVQVNYALGKSAYEAVPGMGALGDAFAKMVGLGKQFVDIIAPGMLDKMKQLADNQPTDISKLTVEQQQAAVTAYQAYQSKISGIEVKGDQERVKVVQQAMDELAKLEENTGQKRSDIISQFASDEASRLSDMNDKRIDILMGYSENEQKITEQQYKDRMKLARDFGVETERMEQDHQRQMERMGEDHTRNLRKLADSRDALAIEDEQESYQVERRRAEEDYQVKAAQRNEDYARQLAEQNAAFEEQRKQRADDRDKQLSDLQKNFDKQDVKYKAAYAKQLSDLDKQAEEQRRVIWSGEAKKLADIGVMQAAERVQALSEWTTWRQQHEIFFAGEKQLYDDYLKYTYDQLQAYITNKGAAAPAATTPHPTTIPGGKYAAGANFIVPAGFPNDSFPMRVSSGERVSVTPAGRGGNMPPINITQSFSGAQAEPEKYKAIMYEVITDVIEQAMRQ